MLDHVTVTAVDFATSLAFYDAIFAALGLDRVAELVDEEDDDPRVEAAAWERSEQAPALWLVAGEPGTTGVHVCVRAQSREQVETFYAAGVAAGGSGHAAPRRWTLYRRGEFHAIVRDPAGNLVEAVAPE